MTRCKKCKFYDNTIGRCKQTGPVKIMDYKQYITLLNDQCYDEKNRRTEND